MTFEKQKTKEKRLIDAAFQKQKQNLGARSKKRKIVEMDFSGITAAFNYPSSELIQWLCHVGNTSSHSNTVLKQLWA